MTVAKGIVQFGVDNPALDRRPSMRPVHDVSLVPQSIAHQVTILVGMHKKLFQGSFLLQLFELFGDFLGRDLRICSRESDRKAKAKKQTDSE